MKRSCHFQTNPSFFAGVTLMWAGVFIRSVLELAGPVGHAAHFLCGAGCGLALIGLLYGSPKTRPLFGKFHAFKLRLLRRGAAN